MNTTTKIPATTTTSVRLPEKELEKWTRAANALKVSRNRLVLDAVAAYLEQTYHAL